MTASTAPIWRRVLARSVFVTSEEPLRLLLMLFAALVGGAVIGQILYEPGATSPVVALSAALGSLFIWLLTFFVHPLVASSVWNAVAKNSKAVGIALTAALIFVVTTALGLMLAALVGLPIVDDLNLDLGGAAAGAGSEVSSFGQVCAFIARPFASPWAHIDLLMLIAYVAAKALIFVPLLPKVTVSLNHMFEIMQELTVKFMLHVLRGLVIAVFFMAIGLVGTHGLGFLAGKVALILAADVTVMTLHMSAVFVVLLLLTGTEVVRYVRTMAPAYIVAFGSSSSMGTLPTTMKCGREAKIPDRILNFIFPFGATVNMDGTCIGILIRTIVALEVLGYDVTLANCWAIGGTVMAASVATAAAPGASIVLLRSVIVSAGAALAFDVPPEVVATTLVPFFATFDFLSDRFRTLTNLWGDSMAALLLKKLFIDIDWLRYSAVRVPYEASARLARSYVAPLLEKLPRQQSEERQGQHALPEDPDASTS